MKVIQKIGPFLEPITFNLSNITYLKIGIEHPHSIPITNYNDDYNFDDHIIVSINKQNNQSSHDFIITEKDILELIVHKENLNVQVHESNDPYIIITVAYDNAS